MLILDCVFGCATKTIFMALQKFRLHFYIASTACLWGFSRSLIV